MARTPYQIGYAFERKVSEELSSRGYKCTQARGSHSPVDVVARKLDMNGEETPTSKVYEIQCKKHGVLSPAEWNKLMDWCDESGGIPILATQEDSGNKKYFTRYFKLLHRKGDKSFFGTVSAEVKL